MAFHSYAQFIRKLFNAYRLAPPHSVTCPSSRPCVDHSVSRLPPATRRPVRTRFRSGSVPQVLSLAADGNSQVHYAKARRHHTRWLRPLVGAWFQGLFHSSVRGAFHLSSRYSFAIGLSVVFSLAGWPPRIQPGFLVSRPTRCRLSAGWGLRVRGFHPLLPLLFQLIPLTPPLLSAVSQPRHARRHAAWLSSSPFARRYWGNRSYFLFLRVLRCFSSPRSPPEYSRMPGSLPAGCPIRTSTGQGIFAPRRGFSQLVTSFIASESQGIPHAPLLHSVIRSGRKAFGLFSPKPFGSIPNQWGRRSLCFF